MKSIIRELLDHPEKIPNTISYLELGDLKKFEERCYAVDPVFVNIWGAGDGIYEFCPDHDPPDPKRELLPWLWILYPELSAEIKEYCDEDLSRLIDEYEADL